MLPQNRQWCLPRVNAVNGEWHCMQTLVELSGNHSGGSVSKISLYLLYSNSFALSFSFNGGALGKQTDGWTSTTPFLSDSRNDTSVLKLGCCSVSSSLLFAPVTIETSPPRTVFKLTFGLAGGEANESSLEYGPAWVEANGSSLEEYSGKSGSNDGS